MQKYKDGKYIYSASDLVHFLACRHLTFLDLKNFSEKMDKSNESELNKLLQKKGFEHEANYFNLLKSQGKTYCEIPKDKTLEERAQMTVNALRSGVDIIFQGVFYKHPWRGDADFLIKTDFHSDLGDFSYEVIDTKLAKNSEPKHLIQLCFYTDLLAHIQGIKPKEMHLVLGDDKKESYKFDDFAFYYFQAKQHFESFVGSVPSSSYPEPCDYCKFCDWQDQCSKQWENDNHLSLIANIQRSQIDKLRKANINTVNALAALSSNASIPDLNPEVFQRLQAQAALQNYKRQTGKDKYELIPFKEGCGFSRLPMPDSGDLFFDMEGDPLYPNGLEYLFGLYCLKNGEAYFKILWAHDHKNERETFKIFMQFLNDYLSSHPHAHIYHYGHYETTALKRLASKYTIAEEQLDNLLRQKIFVDLYKIVRESIRTSEPAYSIKNLEAFYMEKRDGIVSTATDSIIVYNKWRETHDDTLLNDIAKYNEFDCISTYKLREWLLSLKPDSCQWFKGEQENIVNVSIIRKDWEIEYEKYQKLLLADDVIESNKLNQCLADLLEFHKREEKSEWWAKFDRQDKFVDELIDDAECIAGLVLDSVTNFNMYSYRFPPQDYKLRKGDKVINVQEPMVTIGSIENIDDENYIVKILQNKSPLPKCLSISASNFFNPKNIRAAIYRVADSVIAKSGKYSAVIDILNKTIPRIKTRIAGEPIITTNNVVDEVVNIIDNLDNSYLIIQGPPGAGKTHTSAHIIVELMRQGKKIGIAANSHKAIHNLLDKVEKIALEQNFIFSGIKKYSSSESYYNGQYIRSENNADKININVSLIAGTVFLFSKHRFNQCIDYLFIDEAGQVSVADVVAMGTAAKNIILVGDQMQLGQPIQGVHPGEAGLSILEFLLADHATIPPERGIFLNHTHRLHPSICDFISSAFYDNRLSPRAANKQRGLLFKNQIDGITTEGIHVVPVEHWGCAQKSVEEAAIIKKYYSQIIQEKIVEIDSSERALTQNDVLIVTPYNVQVNYLKSVLPDGARVGTVDKFQGQEAPVVLISMVTSSVEDLPRNIEFLYSRNRLNVALSRAQCLAVVFMNLSLLEIPCKKVEQLKLVNTFCWLKSFCIE